MSYLGASPRVAAAAGGGASRLPPLGPCRPAAHAPGRGRRRRWRRRHAVRWRAGGGRRQGQAQGAHTRADVRRERGGELLCLRCAVAAGRGGGGGGPTGSAQAGRHRPAATAPSAVGGGAGVRDVFWRRENGCLRSCAAVGRARAGSVDGAQPGECATTAAAVVVYACHIRPQRNLRGSRYRVHPVCLKRRLRPLGDRKVSGSGCAGASCCV